MTVRKSAAAVACAAAITAGAIAAAAPASASGPGTARYSCSGIGSPVAMTYSRPSANLNMVIPLSTGLPPSSIATATLNGAPGPSGTVGSGVMALSGPFAILPTAPNTVTINFYTSGGTMLGFTNCLYLAGTQTGSWPV